MAGNLTAMIASIFSGSAVTPDPYYEYTTLLLPGNGTNGAQNNTFLDGSTNNFTITRNGNTTQGTFSPFSQTGWGNYFDGNLDYLTVPDNAAFTLGNSDFCIELWINSSPSMAGYAGFFGQWANATTNCSYVFRTQTSQIVQFSYTTTGNGQTGTVVNGSALTTNSWNHLVVCRSGANLAIFQNGTRTATHNISTLTISDSTRDMQIGYSTDGGHVLGYMSNLRLVKGSSVYDPTQTTITVPTAPLTAITNTSLLTCQSNRFIDNSTNNFTITRNGDTRVVAFSPFNPTSSWSATTNGGSGYFDGNGDTLFTTNTAIASGTTAFTVETWVYPTAFSGTSTLYGGVSNIIEIQYSSGGISYNKAGVAGVLSSATAPTLNAWNHIVVVRNTSNNSSLFLNGVRLATTASDSNTFSATTAYIGGSASSAFVFGYISNFRYVNGTAVYDPTQTTLTVPTAPLTNITNTSLLLNFTNAGIYDATSKNDLETVGNAQISTTQSKWGGSSMYFDGTGDYLVGTASDLFSFGTGDFTIDFWIYVNSVSSTQVILDTRATSTDSGLVLYLNPTKVSVFTSNAVAITSTSSITTSVWNYVALRRSSGTLAIYINSSTADATQSYTSALTCPGRIVLASRFNNIENFNGYIQDFRITKGYARSIVVPTAAFPTL